MNLRLDIEFDGTDFVGWQRQAAGRSVQGELERALAILLRLPQVTVIGAGRTDAGVHARGMVANIRTDAPLPDLGRLQRGLVGLLPPDIAVQRVTEVSDDFHARFDARARRYHYHVSAVPLALERRSVWFLPEPLDLDRMNRAARPLLGEHDFAAFCKVKSEVDHHRCTLTEARWDQTDADRLTFTVEANRFLHGMVRALVGTLVAVGRGKWPVEAPGEILASRDRRRAGQAAPAHGLSLDLVRYPDDATHLAQSRPDVVP